MHSDPQTARRLEQIEERLARLEAALQIAAPAPVAAPTVQPPAQSSVQPPAQPPAPPSFAQDLPAADAASPPPIPPPLPYEDVAAPIPTIPYRPVNERLPRPDFEQTIGLKWAGWIGAVVLVIGAALGFKFAYDQGWLGLLPDAGKLAAMSLAGFVLIGAGEFVLRRINRLSAAGLYGAGVAILFLASYAGYAWYGLFAYDAAIALSGVSALLGVLLSARSDLISIAALAILGGAIAPAAIGLGDTPLASLCLYLLALQVMALVLCAWRREPKWWVLRGLSLACIGIWMTGFVAWRSEPLVVITFSLAIAIVYQLELIVTARLHRNAAPAHAGGMVFSMLVTAFFVAWVLIQHRDASDNVRGLWLIATAGATALVGFLLMIDREPVWLGISRSLRIQAVALVTLAVPIFLDGPGLVFGWTMLALLLALLGRLAKLRISMVATAVVWVLAAMAWVAWAIDPLNPSRVDPQTRWLVALLVCLAGHAGALLIRAAWTTATSRIRAVTDPTSIILHVLSAALWAIASLATMSTIHASIAIALYAVVLLAIAVVPVLRVLVHLGPPMLVLSAAVWFFAAVVPRFEGGGERLAPFYNLHAAVGILLAMLLPATGIIYQRLVGDRDESRLLRTVLVAMLPAMLLVVGSLEVDRYASELGRDAWIVRQVGWSVWWAILGAGCIIGGFVFGSRAARMMGLGLIGVTLVKLVIVDLSGVGTGWRILSFVGLGAVLLGTSVLYGRFGDHNTAQEAS